MAHNRKALIVALMATTLLTSGATWAAEQLKAPPSQTLANSESDPRPIQDLSKAAQSLRDATHDMVREQASAKRGDAITQVDKTLAAVDSAMIELPTSLLLADTNQTDSQKSAENLQNAADRLNDAVSALNSDANSGRRNADIKTIKQALAQIHHERLNISGAAASTTGSAASSKTSAQSTQSIPQELRQKLTADGYTEVKIMPGSFLVSAKNKGGEPVLMRIGPDSMTVLTEQPVAQTTGSGAASTAPKTK